MDTSTGIRIHTNNPDVLLTVLELLPDSARLRWFIFEVDGVSIDHPDFPTITEMEAEVDNSKYGYELSAYQLNELPGYFADIWWLTIIGQKELIVSKHTDEETTYAQADVVIDMFDSSYWDVYSKDHAYIAALKDALGKEHNISTLPQE